jgi:tetratricopeptide (TPR) repeat protein
MKADRSRNGRDQSYIHYQRAGEKALQEKRFELAKRTLDQAYSQASHDPNTTPLTLISILDLRIESLLKLRDLDAAGIDARTMVRHDRGDPRGYLRCGQVGRLKNDIAEAQKWYQQGLKKVPQTNESYDKLESMRAKMMCTIVLQQSKLRDPLRVLPMDLIHMVFHFLELWEATSCLRVSKTWRNTLLATHSIWKTLDLLGTKRNVSVRHLKACIRRMPSPPTTVRLNKLAYSAETYLQPYIERWKAIEHLSINLPSLLQLNCASGISAAIKSLHVGEHYPVYFKVVDDLLHCCDLLKSARFDAVLKGFSPNESSPFMVQYHGSTYRKTTLPKLKHLVLTASFKPYETDRWIEPVSLLPSRYVR